VATTVVNRLAGEPEGADVTMPEGAPAV
jgi:hypothetical protein